MKKSFTLLFSLLLAFVSTAVAQITDISQLDNGTKYTVWTSSRGGWAVNADGTEFKSSQDVGLGTTLDPMNEQFHFKFINEGGIYYLFSVKANKYVKMDKTLGEAASDPIEFAPQGDGTFVVKFTDPEDKHYINLGGSNQMEINGWSTADAGNKVTIAVVPDAMVDVTWEYYIDGQLVKTVNERLGSNTDVTAAPIDFFVVDSQSDYNTGSGASITIRVDGHEELPFQKTTDQNNPYWYALGIHTNQAFYAWHFNAVDALVETRIPEKGYTDISVLNDDAYFWCITGNIVEGFKIYNKAAGFDVTLNGTANTATVGTASDGNDTWTIARSSSSIANACCFSIPGMTDYINHQQQDGVHCLKYWGSRDEGSSITFYAPASFVISGLEAYAAAPEGAVGYAAALSDPSTYDDLQNAINSLQSNPYDFDAAKSQAEFCNQLAASEIPMTEGYYRIYSALTPLYEKSKGVYFDGGSFVWGSIDELHVDHIVKVVPSNQEGKWCLIAPNYNRYMQGVAGASNEAETENAGITLNPLGGAQYNLVFGNGTMHANEHGNGAGEGSNLINYSAGMGSASAWYIVPANSLDVLLATDEWANGAYGAAYLPFDVEGEGLNVGVLNSDQSVLKLQDVTEVPAQQGFIIEAAAHTPSVTLNIVSGAAAIEANDITGTLAPTTLDAGHVFNVGKTIGFEFSNSAEVGANQAYVTNSQYKGAIFLRDSDGLPTGIGQAQQGGLNSQAPVFDLSGRRVAGTVKGGVYIQNGHKFIVK